MIFWNFFKSWALHTWASVAGYKTLAEPKVVLRRNQLCEDCDFFQDGTCLKCGCLVMAKTMLATEKCPVGRWNRVWTRRNPPNR